MIAIELLGSLAKDRGADMRETLHHVLAAVVLEGYRDRERFARWLLAVNWQSTEESP